MKQMSVEEYRHFLVGRARTAKLATVRADGRPHVAPIWFDLDGDTIVFTTWHKSVKGKNLQRDPHVCLCVDDEAPPFAFVQIEGTAEIYENHPDMLYWATRLAGRYMGADQAETYGKRNSVPGEWLVRVTPGKIIAQTDVAGW